MKKEKRKYRHGDVILIECEPEEVKGEKLNHLVLAEGEATGHAHRMIDGTSALFEFDEERYLVIQDELATLSHEEHKEIQLPAGHYRVLIQEDYTPKGWTPVVD